MIGCVLDSIVKEEWYWVLDYVSWFVLLIMVRMGLMCNRLVLLSCFLFRIDAGMWNFVRIFIAELIIFNFDRKFFFNIKVSIILNSC